MPVHALLVFLHYATPLFFSPSLHPSSLSPSLSHSLISLHCPLVMVARSLFDPLPAVWSVPPPPSTSDDCYHH
jgi:hypothetical protein